MKNLLLILLLFGLTNANSQSENLPQEKVEIELLNKKTIKNVRLWSINNDHLEYEENNVLKDIEIKSIAAIKGNHTYLISSSDSGHQIVIHSVSQDFNRPVVTALTVDTLNPATTIKPVVNAAEPYDINYYYLGKTDAKRYHVKGRHNKKAINRMLENPNFHLLSTNKAYYDGYMKEVKGSPAAGVILTSLVLIIIIASL